MATKKVRAPDGRMVIVTEEAPRKPIDWTKPVRHILSGEMCEVVTTKGRGKYPVLLYIGAATNMFSATLEGTEIDGSHQLYENVEAIYINVYRDTSKPGHYTMTYYKDKGAADAMKDGTCVAQTMVVIGG